MVKKAERSDALAILTDDDLRSALMRRREVLRQRLADLQVDTLMPGYEPESGAGKQAEISSVLLVEALADIERRLGAASDVLRSFSGRSLGEDHG